MRDYPCKFGESCRRKTSGCQYVHPDEPEYARAVQKKGLQDGRRGGPSSGSVNKWGKPPSSSSNSGAARNPSESDSNASTAWNFHGQSTSNQSGSFLAENSAGFGNSANNNASTSSATGWGTEDANSTWTTNDATLGWGEATPNGAWGSSNSGSNNNAWGTWSDKGGSNSGVNNRGGAWDSITTDTAKVPDGTNSSNATAQNQPATLSFGSWGSLDGGREKPSDVQRDNDDAKKTDDIQMRDPSPPRRPRDPKPKSKPLVLTSATQLSPEPPAQVPLSPTYAAPSSAVVTNFPSDLKSLALEVATPKPKPTKIKGFEGRKTLYKSIIKHTKNAIIAFIEHQEAQTDLRRWKDTQNSSIYGHATLKTRKILDSERATFHRRLQDVDDTFQKEINALVNLPDPSINNKRKPNLLTKEVIAQYTQELQDWFKDLEIHKRLLVAKKKDEEPEEGEIAGEGMAEEEKEEGEVEDLEEEMTGKRLSELRQHGKVTWKELTEIIQGLENRFDTTQTGVYFDLFTHLDDDLREKLKRASASLELIGEEEMQDDGLPNVSHKLAKTGKNLEQQSAALAQLLGEMAVLEKKVEAVRQQTTEAGLVCDLADRLFGEFEQWKEEDNAQLRSITEQIKLLHSYTRTLPSTSESQGAPSVVTAAPHPSATSASAPEPISTNDLIEPIRRLVVETIQKDLTSCFDNLQLRCIENQQKLEMEMEEEAKRIMVKAEKVKRKLTPSREPSVRPAVYTGLPNSSSIGHARAST